MKRLELLRALPSGFHKTAFNHFFWPLNRSFVSSILFISQIVVYFFSFFFQGNSGRGVCVLAGRVRPRFLHDSEDRAERVAPGGDPDGVLPVWSGANGHQAVVSIVFLLLLLLFGVFFLVCWLLMCLLFRHFSLFLGCDLVLLLLLYSVFFFVSVL